MVKIFSQSNQRLKQLLKDKEQWYFFEGDKLVFDMLHRGLNIDLLIVDIDFCKKWIDEGASAAEVWVVNTAIMKKISSLKTPPHLIALLKKNSLRKRINFNTEQVIFALDGIQDPGNVGTIFRCATAFGFHAIALTGKCVNPGNVKFIRTAQTSFFDLDFQYFSDLDSLLRIAIERDFHVYVTSPRPRRKSVKIEDVCFPSLIVLGSEGEGLHEGVFKQYETLTVAQSGGIDSLNVGIAACILMHELKRVSTSGEC